MDCELLVLVKHDCPTCDLLLPALDAARCGSLRVLSQSSREETDGQIARLGLRGLRLDDALAESERFDPDGVPALLLLQDGREIDRVEGLDRERVAELAKRAGVSLDLTGLPAMRPGCASRTRDPEVEARLRARRAREEGRIQSRVVRIGALEDPMEALERRGYTDGLPCVPPTPERVVAMLDHTRRGSQEVVGVLPPYQGTATVEKIAINAVLAGCPPPCLPIVLAAVDAVCEESFSLHGVIATTNPVAPLVVVSGPFAEEVGMNAGGNCLGQGNRANLGIGRALQLTIRNLGGGRPGLDDRATLGQMGKLSACFAELLDGSPWESLSVERGLAPEDTGVTVFAAEGPRVVSDAVSATPESLAATLGMAVDSMSHPKQRDTFIPILVLPPSSAAVFAREGWDKERVKREIWERSKRPARELVWGARDCEQGMDPAALEDDGSGVPKVPSPDMIQIVHAGGSAGSMNMLIGAFAATERGSMPSTRRVEDWR